MEEEEEKVEEEDWSRRSKGEESSASHPGRALLIADTADSGVVSATTDDPISQDLE